jgi:thiol-disulfide isomerase/thioredoxin
MNTFGKLTVVLSAVALAACTGGTTPTDTGMNSDTTPQDAAADATPTDSQPGDAQVCVGHQPPANSPWCAMSGCPFRPVSLPRCDGAGNYDFYGPEFCGASATVLVVAAGWCVPCMMEAPMIESEITQGYAARGVRVLTVYAQNPDGSTPTPDHCMGWQTGTQRPSSSPRGPLTSTMLMDPDGLTQVYTPMNAFPSNVVIDGNGNIYDVIYGVERGLTTLTSDLDAILQAEGR